MADSYRNYDTPTGIMNYIWRFLCAMTQRFSRVGVPVGADRHVHRDNLFHLSERADRLERAAHHTRHPPRSREFQLARFTSPFLFKRYDLLTPPALIFLPSCNERHREFAQIGLYLNTKFILVVTVWREADSAISLDH